MGKNLLLKFLTLSTVMGVLFASCTREEPVMDWKYVHQKQNFVDDAREFFEKLIVEADQNGTLNIETGLTPGEITPHWDNAYVYSDESGEFDYVMVEFLADYYYNVRQTITKNGEQVYRTYPVSQALLIRKDTYTGKMAAAYVTLTPNRGYHMNHRSNVLSNFFHKPNRGDYTGLVYFYDVTSMQALTLEKYCAGEIEASVYVNDYEDFTDFAEKFMSYCGHLDYFRYFDILTRSNGESSSSSGGGGAPGSGSGGGGGNLGFDSGRGSEENPIMVPGTETFGQAGGNQGLGDNGSTGGMDLPWSSGGNNSNWGDNSGVGTDGGAEAIPGDSNQGNNFGTTPGSNTGNSSGNTKYDTEIEKELGDSEEDKLRKEIIEKLKKLLEYVLGSDDFKKFLEYVESNPTYEWGVVIYLNPDGTLTLDYVVTDENGKSVPIPFTEVGIACLHNHTEGSVQSPSLQDIMGTMNNFAHTGNPIYGVIIGMDKLNFYVLVIEDTEKAQKFIDTYLDDYKTPDENKNPRDALSGDNLSVYNRSHDEFITDNDTFDNLYGNALFLERSDSGMGIYRKEGDKMHRLGTEQVGKGRYAKQKPIAYK